MTSLWDIIRAEHPEYAEMFETWFKLADVTADGPPKGGADEGRVSETEPVAPPIDQRVPAKGA